jgi:hypothetical protein
LHVNFGQHICDTQSPVRDSAGEKDYARTSNLNLESRLVPKIHPPDDLVLEEFSRLSEGEIGEGDGEEGGVVAGVEEGLVYLCGP